MSMSKTSDGRRARALKAAAKAAAKESSINHQGDKIIEGLHEALDHARDHRPDDPLAPRWKPPEDPDHCGYVDDPHALDEPGGVRFSDALTIDSPREAIEMALAVFRHYARLHSDKRTDDGDQKAARNRVMAEMCARAFAAASTDEAARDLEEPPAAALARLQHQLSIATQQRDFLVGQCAGLINRLAGSHVAAGFIDMAGAQGFVLKETLPINQVLAQIGAQEQAT